MKNFSFHKVSLKTLHLACLAGVFLLFTLALNTAYAQLKVNGPYLYDECGEQVVFRGVENVIHDMTRATSSNPNGWVNDPYGEYIDDMAATGANAIRIIGGGFPQFGGPAALDDILDRAINEHDMWVSIAWVDWENPEIRDVIKKYESFVSLHAQGEVNHSDDQKWVTDSKAVIDRFRGWGFTCPIELMANDYGQNADIVLQRGSEVFDHDPRGNVVFGVQFYSQYGADPRSKLDEVANFEHVVWAGTSRFKLGLDQGFGNNADTYKKVWEHTWEKGLSTFYWDFKGGDGDNLSCDGTINCLTDVGQFLINNSQYTLGATAEKSNFLVNKTCGNSPSPDNPGEQGTITVRAKGSCGSETFELRIDDEVVLSETVGTSYDDYTYTGYASGDISVHFTNDGNEGCDRNLSVDYVDVCGRRIQSESSEVVQSTNWTNGDRQILFTDGNNNYGNPGCQTTASGGSIVIRAKSAQGTERMRLEVDGQVVQTWPNVASTPANYPYDGYNGGLIKIVFDDDGGSGSTDRNLAVDYIEVCGTTYESNGQGVVRNGCGTDNDQGFAWLWCNGNLDFGDVGCNGNARTATAEAKPSQPEAWPEGLTVYPNPTPEQLTVRGGADYQVTLHDLSGQQVMQRQSLQGQEQLDVSHLRPGVYILKLRNRTHQLQQRVMVE